MTEQDAWEEGGYTLDEYKETFQRIYGFWDDNRIVCDRLLIHTRRSD